MDSTPSPSAPFSVKDALDFAEKLATFELQRIDRMHVRFLWFVGSSITLVLAFLTVIGIVGYNNLRALATEAASAQLRVEVAKQIDTKLSNENLPGIVREEVRAYSASDLRQQVSKEINVGPLHEQIIEVGKKESRALNEKLLTERRLSPDNAAKIKKAIDADDILSDQPFNFYADNLSAEATTYGEEIRKILDDSQLVFVGNNDRTLVLGGPGIIIYCRAKTDCTVARHLAAALSVGGLDARVLEVPFVSGPPPEGKRDWVIVWVGPKYLR